MKIKLTFLFSVVALLASAQNTDKAIRYIESIKAYADSALIALKPEPPKPFVYVPIPPAPTFADAITITTTAAGFNIDNKKLGGKTDAILTNGITGNISATFTVGTKDKPVRISGSGGTVIGNNLTPDKSCFAGVINPRHVEIYNVKLFGKHGGIIWPGGDASNPSTVFAQNVTFSNHNFAGFWINNDGKYYGKLNTSFAVVTKTKGEAFYVGSTNKSNLSHIAVSHHDHVYVDSTAWDGLQFTNVDDLYVTNATVRHTGTANKDGHKRLAQIHACKGVIEYSSFDSGPSGFELFTNGLTIRKSHIQYDGNDAIYVGDWPYGDLGGDPVIIEDVCFKVSGQGPLFNVAMKSATLIVRNCIIPQNRSLFSGAGKYIDGGGNKFVPYDEIESVKYVADPEREGAALVADRYHYDRGIGARTPKPAK